MASKSSPGWVDIGVPPLCYHCRAPFPRLCSHDEIRSKSYKISAIFVKIFYAVLM